MRSTRPYRFSYPEILRLPFGKLRVAQDFGREAPASHPIKRKTRLLGTPASLTPPKRLNFKGTYEEYQAAQQQMAVSK